MLHKIFCNEVCRQEMAHRIPMAITAVIEIGSRHLPAVPVASKELIKLNKRNAIALGNLLQPSYRPLSRETVGNLDLEMVFEVLLPVVGNLNILLHDHDKESPALLRHFLL